MALDPTTGLNTAPSEGLECPTSTVTSADGSDVGAGVPSLPSRIAQGAQVAGQQQPGDWRKNLVAGVQSALAGFAPGPVPPGGGALYGIGKAMQNKQAQDEKTQELQMQKDKQQKE